jgi:hypothetical protein
VNIGPTRRLLEGAAARLRASAAAHGAIGVVGFSVGGLFGRWLARLTPEPAATRAALCSENLSKTSTTRAFLNKLSLIAPRVWAASNGVRRRDRSSFKGASNATNNVHVRGSLNVVQEKAVLSPGGREARPGACALAPRASLSHVCPYEDKAGPRLRREVPWVASASGTGWSF